MSIIIEVTVKSQEGKCTFGHKTSEKVIFDGRRVRGDICYSALMVLLPKIYALFNGIEFPWAKNKDIIFNACPDPENPVVFEIRRIRK